jgi:hypothetical protein
MKKVVNVWKRADGERRIGALKLEVDYELATLYEAMLENDEEKKNECKQRLEKLRQELIRLSIYSI